MLDVFCLMILRPPRSKLTDALFRYTTLCRSITETASTRAWISVTALRTVSSELRTLLAVSEAFSRAWPAAVAIRRLLSFTRSEEHTSELQSLMRISYAVFCLQKYIQYHLQHAT